MAFLFSRDERFYSFPKLLIIRYISSIEVIKVICLFFSNHLSTKISLFACLHSWDLVFRILLRNFERVITVFSISLVIKEDWLFLKVFCFIRANLIKSPREIVGNNSNWLASIFCSFSSFKSSTRNCCLEKFLKSRYVSFLGSSFLE